MTKRSSIKEIAKAANVSIATVSRVINHAGGYSRETGERVRRVAEELGYYSEKTNYAYTQQKPIVGVLVPDISNQYFSNIVSELQKNLANEGFLTMICNIEEQEENAQAYADELLRQQVSALIFVCGYGFDIMESTIPMIYIDRHPMENSRAVIVIESDNVRGGYIAAKELIDCGCRRIAFVTNSLKTSSKRSRYKGYVRALGQAGIPVREELVVTISNPAESCIRQRIRQLLEEDPEIDGIMCTTDQLAVGAIDGARAVGKRVPEDICITGFDDSPIASLLHPGITSVKQDGTVMAKKATDILMTLLNGGQVEKYRYIVPICLSVRESTRGLEEDKTL